MKGFVEYWIDYHESHSDYPLCTYYGTCEEEETFEKPKIEEKLNGNYGK